MLRNRWLVCNRCTTVKQLFLPLHVRFDPSIRRTHLVAATKTSPSLTPSRQTSTCTSHPLPSTRSIHRYLLPPLDPSPPIDRYSKRYRSTTSSLDPSSSWTGFVSNHVSSSPLFHHSPSNHHIFLAFPRPLSVAQPLPSLLSSEQLLPIPSPLVVASWRGRVRSFGVFCCIVGWTEDVGKIFVVKKRRCTKRR